MNKVGERFLPSIMLRQYLSIIFNEKSSHYIGLNMVDRHICRGKLLNVSGSPQIAMNVGESCD
jgi:hypothetical protein